MGSTLSTLRDCSRAIPLRRRAAIQSACRRLFRNDLSRFSEEPKIELQQTGAFRWRQGPLPVINLTLRLPQLRQKFIVSDATIRHKLSMLASHSGETLQPGPPSAQIRAQSPAARGIQQPKTLIDDDSRQQPPQYRAGIILGQQIDLVARKVLDDARMQYIAQGRAADVVRNCLRQVDSRVA